MKRYMAYTAAKVTMNFVVLQDVYYYQDFELLLYIPNSFYPPVEVLPSELEYTKWIKTARHGDLRRTWYNTDAYMDTFRQVKVKGSASFKRFYDNVQSKGVWCHCKVNFLYSQDSTDTESFIPLINHSFLGALFGGGIYSVYEGANNNNLKSYLNLWVKGLDLPAGVKQRYATFKISGSVTTDVEKSMSFVSAVENESLLQTNRNNIQALDNFRITEELRNVKEDFLQQGGNLRELIFKMSMAQIFQAKAEGIVKDDNNNVVQGSDGVFFNDFFAIDDNGLLKLSLQMSFWVGCKGAMHNIATLFNKGERTREQIVYEPKGIDPMTKEGTNCFYECLRHHYDYIISHYQALDEHEQVVKWSEEYDAFIDNSASWRNELLQISKMISLIQMHCSFQVALFCVVKRSTDSPIHSHINKKADYFVTRHLLNSDYAARNPWLLHLFTFPLVMDPSCLFHHCIIIQSPYFNEYSRCSTCHSWFRPDSTHFADNCMRCPSCHRPVLESNKEHFLNCKSRKVERYKEMSTRRMNVIKEPDKAWQLRIGVWYADIEAFSDKVTGNHLPFCVYFKVKHGQGYVLSPRGGY